MNTSCSVGIAHCRPVADGSMSRFMLKPARTLFKSPICRCRLPNSESLKKGPTIYSSRTYVNKKLTENENVESKDEDHNLPSGFAGKYKIFRDEDAPVIFDVNEEKKRIELGELNIEDETVDPYEGINMNHGISGVFDIEDLVELLRKDNARQIFVASVPQEYAYVDYIVVVTGRTSRHMQALAAFVRKVYKMKKYKSEKIPKIEGEHSEDWVAIDLGNIALHIFSYQARLKYDLETLWSVGSQFDDLSNKKDDDLDLMDKYKAFLKDLQPAE